MNDSIVSQSFEHLQTQTLPKKVRKIISSIVRRHRHTSGELHPKQLELAAAFLRMRLYQAYGHNSKQYTEAAMNELERQLQTNIKEKSTYGIALETIEYST